MPSRPVAEGLFTVDDGVLTLRGGWSPTSGLSHFPFSPACPWSGAQDVEPRPLPRTGRLLWWTAVTSPPPGYQGPVPYGFGVVELDDGLRVVGRLTVAEPGLLRGGEAVEVVAEELPDGEGGDVVTWAFAPVERRELQS